MNKRYETMLINAGAFVIVALLSLGVLWLFAPNSWWGSVTSLGKDHSVIMYSGGKEVRRWTSSGKVTSGKNGNRFAFEDKETGGYVRVADGVAVEEIVE